MLTKELEIFLLKYKSFQTKWRCQAIWMIIKQTLLGYGRYMFTLIKQEK